MRVLVIEDQTNVANYVKRALEEQGYAVDLARTGREALDWAEVVEFDLIVLDIMLPEMDGLEVLRQIRQSSDAYVIMLTAKSDELDKVVGLTMGADDYVAKPFSPRELVARVKSALRRLDGSNGQTMELVSRRVTLDGDARLVWKDEDLLDLTPIEFDLLHTLMRHHGRVLSGQEITEEEIEALTPEEWQQLSDQIAAPVFGGAMQETIDALESQGIEVVVIKESELPELVQNGEAGILNYGFQKSVNEFLASLGENAPIPSLQ